MTKKLIKWYLIIISLSLLLQSCNAKVDELSESRQIFGTTCTIRIIGNNKAVFGRVFSRLQQIETNLNNMDKGSEVDQVNKNAGIKAVKVSQDLIQVIEQDMYYASISEGAFDPSVGPLVKLWNITSANPIVPSKDSISRTLQLVNWKNIILNKENKTLYLKGKNQALDLGSTTKGFAADEVARILKSAGITNGIISLGGNVLVLGTRLNGMPWRVGLQDPFAEAGKHFGIANISDTSMVTSGVYQRYFLYNGQRYHHIMDPKTGYPSDNGIMSVTIFAAKSINADGMSTTLLVLGKRKAIELAKKFGVSYILVDDQHRVFTSADVPAFFRIIDSSFVYAE